MDQFLVLIQGCIVLEITNFQWSKIIMSRRSGTIVRTRRKSSRKILGSLDPDSLQIPIIEESEPDLTEQGSDEDDLESQIGNDIPQFKNPRDEAYEDEEPVY